MNNKQLYEDTFNSIKMSEEALKKVKEISEEDKKNSRKIGMRVTGMAAAAMLLFVLGNGVVYAATGNAPMAKFFYMMMERAYGEKEDGHIVAEGDDESVSTFYYSQEGDSDDDADQDKNGNDKKNKKEGSGNNHKSKNNSSHSGDKSLSVIGDGDSTEGDAGSLETDAPVMEDTHSSIISKTKTEDGKTDTEAANISGVLKQDGEKIYLVIGDNEETVDITKDFSDGSAKGEVEIKGITYKYSVSGTLDDYSIVITKE